MKDYHTLSFGQPLSLLGRSIIKQMEPAIWCYSSYEPDTRFCRSKKIRGKYICLYAHLSLYWGAEEINLFTRLSALLSAILSEGGNLIGYQKTFFRYNISITDSIRVNNYYGKYSARLLPCSDFWYAGIKGLCLVLCYLALSVNIIPIFYANKVFLLHWPIFLYIS